MLHLHREQHSPGLSLQSRFQLSSACSRTFEHVHHAEEGQREGGLAAARPAADPHLEANRHRRDSAPSEAFHRRLSVSCEPQHVRYLLPRADVRIDVLEHRLQRGVVSHAQVLDLNLAVLRPAVGNLRHS